MRRDEQKQYIMVDGRLQRNPNYSGASAAARSTLLDPSKALTTAYTTEATFAAQEASGGAMPQAVEGVVVAMQDDAYAAAFGVREGLRADELLNGLSDLFAQNEIPIGLMPKLIALQAFALHFKIDDSGSMTSPSPMKRQEASAFMMTVGDPNQLMLTRWEEAEDRLHVLMELIKVVPTQSITLSFLNDPRVIILDRQGKTPAQFANDVHTQIRALFSRRPDGSTPIAYNMKKMLRSASGKTMHYLLTDGEPSGGAREIMQIKDLLLSRRTNAANHPFTFLGCSNREEDMEWMREIEDIAPYVAAVDDFAGERREVYRDQGPAIPYSRGFWLLCNLTAALNPDDLDALDQHAPLTKTTLDNLLGREHSEQEYRYYFDTHPHARQLFGPDYSAFLKTDVARNIPSVARFRAVFAAQLNQDINNGDDDTEARAEQIAANVIIREFGGRRYFNIIQRQALFTQATALQQQVSGGSSYSYSANVQSAGFSYASGYGSVQYQQQPPARNNDPCPCAMM